MTVIIKLDGEVIATITGEGIEHGRRVDPHTADWRGADMVPDPHVLVMRKEGKTLWVLTIAASDRVTLEELP